MKFVKLPGIVTKCVALRVNADAIRRTDDRGQEILKCVQSGAERAAESFSFCRSGSCPLSFKNGKETGANERQIADPSAKVLGLGIKVLLDITSGRVLRISHITRDTGHHLARPKPVIAGRTGWFRFWQLALRHHHEFWRGPC